MSKLAGIGFVAVDAAATLMCIANQTLTMGVMLIAALTSSLVALSSSTVRAMCQPKYFWDE